MAETWHIRTETCKACGTCVEVCPNQLLQLNAAGRPEFRAERLWLCFRCGHCMAACPTQSVQVPGLDDARDFFDLPPADGAAEDSFFRLVASRRAVRNFQDRPVPAEVLEKVVNAIQFAPPSFPPLKTELVVVQDRAVLRQALPLMTAMYAQLLQAVHHPIARLFVRRELGAAKYRTLTQHVVPLMQVRLPGLKAGTEDTITRGAAALILFHVNPQVENYLPDAYIAVAYGLLAAHACGLGGAAIDLIAPVVEHSPDLRALFQIPAGHTVVAAIILGYPKRRFKRGIRRKLPSVTWL